MITTLAPAIKEAIVRHYTFTFQGLTLSPKQYREIVKLIDKCVEKAKKELALSVHWGYKP